MVVHAAIDHAAHLMTDHLPARQPEGTASSPELPATRLRRMVEVMSDVFVVVDAECRITWVSPSALEVLGQDTASLTGTLAYDLFAKQENRELHRRVFDEALATPGRHGPVEITLARADGGFRELELVLTNQLDDPELAGVVVSIRDITRRPGAVEELRRREAWADALIRRGAELILVTDRRGIISYANPASATLLGVQPEALVGISWFDLIHQDDRASVAPNGSFGDLIGQQRDRNLTLRVVRSDGGIRYLHVYVSNLLGDPNVAGVVVNATDVTDRFAAENLLAEQASLLEAMARGLPLHDTLRWITRIIEERVPGASPAVGVLDVDGWVRYPVLPSHGGAIIEAFDQMAPDSDLGSSLRSIGSKPSILTKLTGRWWSGVAHLLDDLDLHSCWTWPAFSTNNGELVGALVVMHRDRRGPTEAEAALLERSMNLAAIAIDRHHLQSTLEYRAQHDALTGLPNRVSLIDGIDRALTRARGSGLSVAVLFVDLDRFKLINDSLGHAVGDLLLEQVATRFRSALRPNDVVGRFGGDEFVVVCDGVDDDQVAVAVADRLRRALAAPFIVDKHELVVTASIGIAQTLDPDTIPDALIRDADVAMYRAKGRGRDTAVVFQSGDQERVARVLELEHLLRLAIDGDDLTIHCQPVVRTVDGVLVGFEALVRWEHPALGVVCPVEMIPVAEESGLILGLGRVVLAKACSAAATWPPRPDGSLPWISVNVSARQFADPRFPGHVAEALDASGLAPDRLCLELTETAFVGDDAVAVSALVGLKALGVRIAIDDFGTGHASLDYIRRFAVADVLKIDRSFVAGLNDERGHDRAIIAAVVAMGRSLGFTVIAEGVETSLEQAALVELDCELSQGFWFGYPAPVDQLEAVQRADALPIDRESVP